MPQFVLFKKFYATLWFPGLKPINTIRLSISSFCTHFVFQCITMRIQQRLAPNYREAVCGTWMAYRSGTYPSSSEWSCFYSLHRFQTEEEFFSFSLNFSVPLNCCRDIMGPFKCSHPPLLLSLVWSVWKSAEKKNDASRKWAMFDSDSDDSLLMSIKSVQTTHTYNCSIVFLWVFDFKYFPEFQHIAY